VAAVAPDAEPPFDPVLDQAVEPVPAGAVRRLS